MAVPAYLRQDSKAEFVTVAVRLAAWTLKWCKDERLFTRRERWIITGDTGRQLENMDRYLDSLLAAIEKGGHENEHQYDQRTAPRACGSAGQTPDQHHGQHPGRV